MPTDDKRVDLGPMEEVELELPWLREQAAVEERCVDCDDEAEKPDVVEPEGGESAFVDVEAPLLDLF